MTSVRHRVLAIAASTMIGIVSARCSGLRPGSRAIPSASRMADGKDWMTQNVNVDVQASYCYENDERQCRRYGRLYTWDAARQVCESFHHGWRLPSDEDWRRLASAYAGVGELPADSAKASYSALLVDGRSGFNALLGGGRELEDGRYARLEAHGFYWTSTERDSAHAVFYNFAKGSKALYRQPDGEKQRAFSVRCVRVR